MTRDEFEAILEQAFIEGYEDACEEIKEYLDESSDDYIDIDDNYKVYYESSKNVRREMDKLKSDNSDNYIARYRNGIDYNNPKSINKGLDWAKFANIKNLHLYGGEVPTIAKEYFVKNTALSKSSTPRGRIKVGDSKLGNESRMGKIAALVKRNKRLVDERGPREMAKNNLKRANKVGVFANKGNKY